MHTRLALATVATVKAEVPISHNRPTSNRGPSLAYTDLAYYGVWDPDDDIKRKSKTRQPKPEVKRTRETPNIDSLEISNLPLCPVARVSYDTVRYGHSMLPYGNTMIIILRATCADGISG